MAGLRVRTHVVFAYTAAGSSTRSRRSCSPASASTSTRPSAPRYLLAPIAAVVIAGASLSGGLASATSTWVAALALTLLTQMLLILGLSTAMQFIVFGAAIIVGMLVSGDRVASLLGRVLRPAKHRRRQPSDRRKHELRLERRNDARRKEPHRAEAPDRWWS